MAASAKKAWQKNETRSVRPFRSAEDYLWDVGLRLYPDQEFSTIESVSGDDLDLDRLSISVRVPKVSTNIEEVVGVPPKDLTLAISLEDRAFKTRDVAHHDALKSCFDDVQVIDLPDDVVQQISWSGEVKVYVAVVLAESRQGELGTAERMGSWLAQKIFTIGKQRETSTFNIMAVDPDFFQTRGLPRSTTYFVEIADNDLNVPCEALPQLIKVYIAKDVHAALGRDEGSAASKAFVRSIHVDVVTTVLTTGFQGLTGMLEPDGILDVVSRRLAKSSGIPVSTLEKLAKDSAGAGLRAVVQAEVDLSRAIVSAAQRRAG
jgi:hypothetical protein